MLSRPGLLDNLDDEYDTVGPLKEHHIAESGPFMHASSALAPLYGTTGKPRQPSFEVKRKKRALQLITNHITQYTPASSPLSHHYPCLVVRVRQIVRAHLLIRSRTARVQGSEGKVTSSDDRNRAGDIHHPGGIQRHAGGSRVEEDGHMVPVRSCTDREVGSRAGRGRRSDHEAAGSRPRGHGGEAIGTWSGPRSNRGVGSCRGSRHGTHLGVDSSQQVVGHGGPSHRAEGRDDGRLGSETGRGHLVVACRAGSVLAEY